jgi:hypothetical protein
MENEDILRKCIHLDTLYSNDCFNGKYTSPKEWNDLSPEELNTVYENLFDKYSQLQENSAQYLETVREHAWRFPIFHNTEWRISHAIDTIVLSGLATEAKSLPPEVIDIFKLFEESERTGNYNALKLYKGDEKEHKKVQLLENLYNSRQGAVDFVCGEKIVDLLIFDIPTTQLPNYSKNAYTAALEVFNILYPDVKANIEGDAENLQKSNTTPDDNIQQTILHHPTLREYFSDKIHIWKELNITPVAARVKLLTGKGLAENEAERLVEEIDLLQEGADKTMREQHRRDVKDRVYTERVLARSLTLRDTHRKKTATAGHIQVKPKENSTATALPETTGKFSLAPAIALGIAGLLLFKIIGAILGFIIGLVAFNRR